MASIWATLIGGPYDGERVEFTCPGGLLPDAINGMDGHEYHRVKIECNGATRTMWAYKPDGFTTIRSLKIVAMDEPQDTP